MMSKKEMEPEELMRRKFLAKCRFRAIGRMVMANKYWLIEASEQYEGIEDVKRRVAQAVRGKAKKKRLLSINDKALLNKPAELRTDQEKKYIYRIIGGLKCFKRYPDNVKKKLAAVTYFRYYGPGRVIVRQHHEAHAMFFLVTGDVIVSQVIFDELIHQNVSVDIGAMHAGDMFGEVSLLHNIRRTATVTTAGHCELLALMKEDFKNVLLASVQKQWDEVKRAMSAFSYFDALDEVARREGCIVAKMKTYETNETILGDGAGVANFVYFLLSGRCQMIESLNIIVKTHLGRNTYTLYDPYVHRHLQQADAAAIKSMFTVVLCLNFMSKIPEEESEQDIDAKYFANKTKPEASSSFSQEAASAATAQSTSKAPCKSSIKSATESKEIRESTKSQDLPTKEDSLTAEGKRKSQYIEKSNLEANVTATVDSEWTPSTKSETILKPTEAHRESVRFSIVSRPIPPKIKTYFMQVCQFNPGATFGFGENMRDRRIIALCPVECMLLPKIWLLQRNTANIWSRIQHYLEKKIPQKKELFKSFVEERRWTDYRDQLVENIVARSKTVNYTSLHDVPYSIRIEEMLDI